MAKSSLDRAIEVTNKPTRKSRRLAGATGTASSSMAIGPEVAAETSTRQSQLKRPRSESSTVVKSAAEPKKQKSAREACTCTDCVCP